MKALKSLAAAVALALVGSSSAFAFNETFLPTDPGIPGVSNLSWTIDNTVFTGGAAGTTFDDFYVFNVPDTEIISFGVDAVRNGGPQFQTSFLTAGATGGWALWDYADQTVLQSQLATQPFSVDSNGTYKLTSGTYVLELAGQYLVKNGAYNGYIAGVQAVPEPATWTLLLAGTGIVGGIARRRSLKG